MEMILISALRRALGLLCGGWRREGNTETSEDAVGEMMAAWTRV